MRIAVLTGGTSSERDVAIASAVQVIQALRSRGHRVAAVDTARGFIPPEEEAGLLSSTVGKQPPAIEELLELERSFLLSELTSLPMIREAEVVFLALHGGRGEDGTMQALLDVAGLPYTGSPALGSGLAANKDIAKRLFRMARVPTAHWLMTPATLEEAERELGWPMVVKPCKQGSTVGLSVVKEPLGYDAAVELAARYDSEVMLEAFVPGRELTVGILEGQSLAVGEIIPQHEIFDYECKYTPGMSEEIFPARLPPGITAECCRLGLMAHQALKLGSYSRVDFRLTPEGELLCLEVNALPGMTATSLLPQSAAAVGISFAELCERVCLASRKV